MSVTAISFCATLLIGAAVFCASVELARVRPLPRPELGPRGAVRARLLRHPGLPACESVVRFLAAPFARMPCPALRARVEGWIERAGHPLGLCADECFALSALLGLGAGTVAAVIDLPPAVAGFAGVLGVATPALSLHDRARVRQHEIARRLPAAIDLMALCMGAGLDFAAALELVTCELGSRDDALGDELRRVLQELAMGRVRHRALAELAERVPTAAVQDFAHAVIQAEQSGTPLAQVLEVQARMLRMRRSIAAEEAAARAAVLLVLPLLLLLAAVVLVMFGPFLVNGMGL